MYKRIFMIAAYSPPGNSTLFNLGASKKIESMLRILRRMNKKVVLINTAHNSEELKNCSVKRQNIADCKVITITPFSLYNRKIGKLFNLFFAIWLAMRLRKPRKQFLLWCYNGYAFECLFALFMPKNQHIVIEMEDMPFSRKRGFIDIKNRLDSFLLSLVLKRVTLITCVNNIIADNFKHIPAEKVLFPSIISQQLASQHFDIAFSRATRTIGYFGGLNTEKGADIVLQLITDLPAGWQVIVTGSGGLSEQFFKLANSHPDKLLFGYNVPEIELYQLMEKCDVLINPHKPIEEMGNGIFPFKVYEYLYTRRLVLTTRLPKESDIIESALVFFDGSVESLKQQLSEADRLFAEKKLAIDMAANFISERYTVQGFSNTIISSLAKLN